MGSQAKKNATHVSAPSLPSRGAEVDTRAAQRSAETMLPQASLLPAVGSSLEAAYSEGWLSSRFSDLSAIE